MMTQNCSLCGVVIEPERELCETCFAMLNGRGGGISPNTGNTGPIGSPSDTRADFAAPAPRTTIDPAPGNHPDSARGSGSFDGFSSSHDVLGQPAIAFNARPAFESQPVGSIADNPEMRAAALSFVPPAFATLDGTTESSSPIAPPNRRNFRPPPRRLNPVSAETEYKPSIWNWFTELPAFVKIGAVVLIFAACFAGALKYFITMDVSIAPALGNTEPQKPWFSAWFRKNPTADEVFEKYEAVTYTTGKTQLFKHILISGKGQYLYTMPDGSLDVNLARKNILSGGQVPQSGVTPPPGPNAPAPSTRPKLPEFYEMDIAFEIAMKHPNKMLMKMNLRPKPGFSQAFRATQAIGFDGDRGWSLTKTYMNESETVRNSQFQPKTFFFNNLNDGISLNFMRAMYTKSEIAAMDTTYGRLNYNLRLADEKGETNLMFDIETGLLSRVSRNGDEIYVLDHDNFDGVLIPSKLFYRIGREWLYLQIEKVETNKEFDDSIFLRSSNP